LGDSEGNGVGGFDNRGIQSVRTAHCR
jgi:hypothetical protein